MAVFVFCWLSFRQLYQSDLVNPVSLEPSFVSLQDSWITPGNRRSFSVQIYNSSNNPIILDDLWFSCPCANGSIRGQTQPPFRLPGGTVSPLVITITSDGTTNGQMDLDFGVRGQLCGRLVEATGIAEVRFAQHVNVSPSILEFNATKSDDLLTRHVDLWCPDRSQLPDDAPKVLCEDPSISTHVEVSPNPRLDDDHGATRTVFGRITVTFSPRLAAR